MKILAISGSLRRDSYNTKLLRAAEELFPPEVDFVLYQGVKEVPPYDEEDDVQPAPMSVAALRSAIREADAVLFATLARHARALAEVVGLTGIAALLHPALILIVGHCVSFTLG